MCTPSLDHFSLKRLLFFVGLLIVLSGCGVANQSRVPQQNSPPSQQQNNILDALNQAHNDWKGTPYILGGSGIGGVDCSSFTQIVFSDYFGVELPRNTRQQINEGMSVRRNYMRAGDLVFFKTGRNLLHVGIVMDGDKFLHASVSSGVMISNLSQRYWATKYLATRRIL
jgi:cell wall-associated NlpC family hydrolase